MAARRKLGVQKAGVEHDMLQPDFQRLPLPGPYTASFFHRWGDLEERGRLSRGDRYWLGVLSTAGLWSREQVEVNYWPVIRRLKQSFPVLHGKNILEIGCGGGILLRFLKEVEGVNVRGVDTSKLAIDYARRCNNLNGEVEAGGLSSLDGFPSSWADVILSVRVMEPLTLTDSQVRGYLRHSDHVLRRGGLHLHFVTENVHEDTFRRLGYADVTTEPLKGGLFNYCITAKKR